EGGDTGAHGRSTRHGFNGCAGGAFSLRCSAGFGTRGPGRDHDDSHCHQRQRADDPTRLFRKSTGRDTCESSLARGTWRGALFQRSSGQSSRRFGDAAGQLRSKADIDPLSTEVPVEKGSEMNVERHETGPRMSKVVIHGDTVYLAGIVADNPKGKS